MESNQITQEELEALAKTLKPGNGKGLLADLLDALVQPLVDVFHIVATGIADLMTSLWDLETFNKIYSWCETNSNTFSLYGTVAASIWLPGFKGLVNYMSTPGPQRGLITYHLFIVLSMIITSLQELLFGAIALIGSLPATIIYIFQNFFTVMKEFIKMLIIFIGKLVVGLVKAAVSIVLAPIIAIFRFFTRRRRKSSDDNDDAYVDEGVVITGVPLMVDTSLTEEGLQLQISAYDTKYQVEAIGVNIVIVPNATPDTVLADAADVSMEDGYYLVRQSGELKLIKLSAEPDWLIPDLLSTFVTSVAISPLIERPNENLTEWASAALHPYLDAAVITDTSGVESYPLGNLGAAGIVSSFLYKQGNTMNVNIPLDLFETYLPAFPVLDELTQQADINYSILINVRMYEKGGVLQSDPPFFRSHVTGTNITSVDISGLFEIAQTYTPSDDDTDFRHFFSLLLDPFAVVHELIGDLQMSAYSEKLLFHMFQIINIANTAPGRGYLSLLRRELIGVPIFALSYYAIEDIYLYILGVIDDIVT